MKTNPHARHIVKIRSTLSMLALVAILGAEIGLGWSMAIRVGQTSSVIASTQDAGVNVGPVHWGLLQR